jgi:hypothetical protein
MYIQNDAATSESEGKGEEKWTEHFPDEIRESHIYASRPPEEYLRAMHGDVVEDYDFGYVLVCSFFASRHASSAPCFPSLVHAHRPVVLLGPRDLS